MRFGRPVLAALTFGVFLRRSWRPLASNYEAGQGFTILPMVNQDASHVSDVSAWWDPNGGCAATIPARYTRLNSELPFSEKSGKRFFGEFSLDSSGSSVWP